MGVESELVAFLDDRIRSAARQRDIELVAYFYGFREDEWPTLEDAAGAFWLLEPRETTPNHPRL